MSMCGSVMNSSVQISLYPCFLIKVLPQDFITKTLQGSIDWIASQGFLEGPYSIIVAHKDQLSMKLLGPPCTMLALTIFLLLHLHYYTTPLDLKRSSAALNWGLSWCKNGTLLMEIYTNDLLSSTYHILRLLW